MTYQAYAAYGELRDGWRLERLKFFADVRNSSVDKVISEDEIPVRLCNYTDVYYNHQITSDMSFTEGSVSAAELAKFRLRCGQVLLTKDSESWQDIGVPALVVEDMPNVVCGYHLAVLDSQPELDGGYLVWLCRSAPLNDQFKVGANGVTRFGLGQYPLKNALIAIPPIEIQQRIARFLDEKTKRIDALIEKKQALLERLAEKRQALITHAVTKGLDPDAPMKPSGVDWLGDIPIHWDLKRLRFLCDGGTLNGLYKPKEQHSADGVPFVQMGEAFRSEIFDGNTKDRVLSSEFEVDKWGLKPGDFLIARRSLVFEGSGKSVMIGAVDEDHVFESSMIRIRLLFPKTFSGFLSNYFRSSVCRAFVLSITKQVTISGIDSQQLKEVLIPVPPEAEAQKISETCQKLRSDIEVTEKSVTSSVALLSEHRSALITAAVTGQLADLNG